jgi:hypothetical protein
MKISIVSPQMREDERIELLRKACDLMRKQARSNLKYAKQITNLLNKASRIDGSNYL